MGTPAINSGIDSYQLVNSKIERRKEPYVSTEHAGLLAPNIVIAHVSLLIVDSPAHTYHAFSSKAWSKRKGFMHAVIDLSIRMTALTFLSCFLYLLAGASDTRAEVGKVLVNGVFEGGGVKGIGLVGALTEVENAGFRFRAVAGTSAGSIVAALYAAGYSSGELKLVLEETEFSDLLDPAWPQFVHFFNHFGVYKGEKIYKWIYSLLERKGIVTFNDLKGMDLKIVASDLTNKQILVFDIDRNPTMKVAEAVRMSIGIPLFFDAYHLGEKLVVDGGLLSNYPVGIFGKKVRRCPGLPSRSWNT
jgi:Patatin-like phospholipase